MTSTFLYGGHCHANGIRQHYLRYGGKGQPLLVIPGITSPAITWGFVAEKLGETHDVYVLDVRGRGLSESGPTLDYSLDTCADDVISLLEVLDLRDVIVLGHSMGARHAIRAARRQGNRMAQLILVDPPTGGPGRRPYPSKLPWYVDSMKLARHGATIEAMRAFVPTWTDAQVQLRCEWLHTCEEAAVLTSFAGFHDDDIHQDIPLITHPMALIAAERGDVVLPEDMAEFVALSPKIHTDRVPNAGHMIPWDNFDGFFAALKPLLDL